MPRRACPVLTGWAGMNAAISKPDRPDILVRQPHFRRDWKVSAIREAKASPIPDERPKNKFHYFWEAQ
jgi:hypothetical protein